MFFFKPFFLNPSNDSFATFSIQSPNGTTYSFSTNSLDKNTVENFKEKLQNASTQEEFDTIWKELSGKQAFFFEENFLPSFFSFPKSSLLETKPKEHTTIQTEEDIDALIQKHQEQIKELEKKKEMLQQEAAQEEIKKEIAANKKKIDELLVKFGQHLDNEKMKEKISKELTAINNRNKELEAKLSRGKS